MDSSLCAFCSGISQTLPLPIRIITDMISAQGSDPVEQSNAIVNGFEDNAERPRLLIPQQKKKSLF